MEPIYNSANTDNDTRMAIASAYGCHAGIEVIPLVTDLSDNTARLAGGAFWGLLAELFPSSGLDRVPESGALASDALMATTKPGWPLLPANLINTTTFNPGSLIKGDRTAEANFYLLFTSMATIGGLNTRYGAPDTSNSYAQTIRLPWRTAADVDADGCMYAAAVINLVDALEETSTNVTGTVQITLQTISDTFATGIRNACDIGCQDLDPDLGGEWQASGCATTTACSECTNALRNRDACLAATDQTRCAAAGIVNFINDSPDLGPLQVAWPGP
jgi:hypothetical protein